MSVRHLVKRNARCTEVELTDLHWFHQWTATFSAATSLEALVHSIQHVLIKQIIKQSVCKLLEFD